MQSGSIGELLLLLLLAMASQAGCRMDFFFFCLSCLHLDWGGGAASLCVSPPNPSSSFFCLPASPERGGGLLLLGVGGDGCERSHRSADPP